jgi:hypothetical protein
MKSCPNLWDQIGQKRYLVKGEPNIGLADGSTDYPELSLALTNQIRRKPYTCFSSTVHH